MNQKASPSGLRIRTLGAGLFTPAVEHHPRLLFDFLELSFPFALWQRADPVDLLGRRLLDRGVLPRLTLRGSLAPREDDDGPREEVRIFNVEQLQGLWTLILR